LDFLGDRSRSGGRLDHHASLNTPWTQRLDGDLVRVSQRSYMVAIARILLREMTESDIGTTPVEDSKEPSDGLSALGSLWPHDAVSSLSDASDKGKTE
jgi:hypothetical protein